MKKLLFFLIVNTIFLSNNNAFANQSNFVLKNKQDADKLFDLGIKKYEENNTEEAIKIFNKIINKFPAYADAHYYLGVCYFLVGKYYQSVSSYLEANKIYDGKKMDAMFGAGISYLSIGYTEEAKIAFQRVIKNSNDNDLIEDSRNWINSIEEQVLQKDKIKLLSEDINFRTGIEFLEKENYNLAEEFFRKSLENEPSSTLILYYIGNTLYLLNKYNESIEVFEKIILIDSESKIANDSKLYIKAIREIISNLNIKTFQGDISVGTVYDSNISYSDISDIIMSDAGLNTDLNITYNFDNNLSFKYNFQLNNFSGINDNLPNLTFRSSNFNIQRHNLFSNYHKWLDKDIFGEIEYNGRIFLLGGDLFTISNSISPKLTYYMNSNFVTTLKYMLELNNYPNLGVRNSLDHYIDLSQYVYLMDNNLWLRVNYNLQRIFANDSISTQSGFLTNGNKYTLNYRFSNSLLSNSLGLDIGFNSVFNSKFNIVTKMFLNNYQNPDVYNLSIPVTNLENNQTEMKSLTNLSKNRTDIRYLIGFNYMIPLQENLSFSISYNYILNSSNITKNDYISRSYDKQMGYMNLIYSF